MMEVRKGDVIYLKRKKDDRMSVRPYVVVSNDIGNHYSGICLVVPLTMKIKKLTMPTHAVLNFHGSMMLCEQIHTIQQADIDRIAHHLSKTDMEKVDKCLKSSLAL